MITKLSCHLFLLLGIISRIFGAADDHAGIKPQEAETLRVMTYNIRREGKEGKPERLWNNRSQLLIDLIQEIGPDIMGLQEVTPKQLSDINNALSPLFTSFGESRGSSLMGFGADEGTPIYYKRDKLSASNEEQGTFVINAVTNSILGIWTPFERFQTGWLPRICTWGRFKINETGQEFYFYNTHFDHMFDEAKVTCAKSIANHIMKQNKENLPVILVGDFNADFTDRIKDIFSDFKNGLDSAVEKYGPVETETGWTEDKLKKIDHIVVKGISQVLYHAVIPRKGAIYPSDHRPVFADVTI